MGSEIKLWLLFWHYTNSKHDDIGTDDTMLLVVYNYQTFSLKSCKLPAI